MLAFERSSRLLTVAATLLFVACASTDSNLEWRISDDLQVRKVADGVWLHTSWAVLRDGSRYPSNGLIVRDGRGVMLVDTAWGEQPTAELLKWIDDTLHLPVTRAVITHSHDDRIGGASLLVGRGVTMHAHPLTGDLAEAGGFPRPSQIPQIERPGSASAVGPVEVFYAGPAHTRDNVLVWVPSRRILFGGCAIRAASSSSAGNVADAVIGEWPETIRRAIARYGEDVRIVVPGHGEPGDASLLRHTLSIVEGL